MSNWDELARTVSPRVIADAQRVSETLTKAGIPHALVGGLAVGLHGHPRATKDVDFIVGEQAFAATEPFLIFDEQVANLVQWGVIDLIAALPEDPVLEAALGMGSRGNIPVVSIEVLVLMKLRAGRTQDLADVEALVRAGGDVATILAFLQRHQPEHVPMFGRCAQRAVRG